MYTIYIYVLVFSYLFTDFTWFVLCYAIWGLRDRVIVSRYNCNLKIHIPHQIITEHTVRFKQETLVLIHFRVCVTKVSPSNCQYLLMSTFAQKGDKVPLAPQPPIQKFSKRGGGGLRWTIRNNFLRIHVIDMFNIIIKQINMSCSSFFSFFFPFFPCFFALFHYIFLFQRGRGGGQLHNHPTPWIRQCSK